ncbi:hypothetical protein [Kitasatospora sp. NPDC058478]|uniref:hypothetical protein n=1 Tax=unclassified Kitasatospora TaxID=2633591 RepID=UPI003653EEE7
MILTASTLATAFEHLATHLDGYTPTPRPDDDPNVQRLTNTDGRTIGARTRIESMTLQLWITAPGIRPGEPRPIRSGPLQPGRSYHTVMHLHGLDGDPAQLIHSALTRDLLPAFDTKPLCIGHRPWEAATSGADDQPADTTPPTPDANPGPHVTAPLVEADTATEQTDTTADTSDPDTPPADEAAPAADEPAQPATPANTPTPKAKATRKRTASTPRARQTPADKTPRTPKTATKTTATKTTATKTTRTRKATAKTTTATADTPAKTTTRTRRSTKTTA